MADVVTIIDGTDIEDSIAAAGDFLVKSGTYAGDAVITLDQANTRMVFEPGTTITVDGASAGINITAANVELEFGPGCTVDNAGAPSTSAICITVAAANCSIRFLNGCTVGNISVTSAGDRCQIDGGGWGTIIESIAVVGDDQIVQYTAIDSKASSTTLFAIKVTATGGRAQILFNKVINADSEALWTTDTDCLFLGNIVMASDSKGIRVQQARNRLIGNTFEAAILNDDIELNAASDNNLIAANVCNGLIQLLAGADNNVVTANRAGSIEELSTTSMVIYNDTGTASCAVTGTLAAGSLESEIVSGGQTLIFTLTNASFRGLSAGDLATAWQALLVGDRDADTLAWDDASGKDVALASGACVLSSNNTILTIILVAITSPNYDIAGNETVSLAAGVLDSTVLATELTITPDDVDYVITEGS